MTNKKLIHNHTTQTNDANGQETTAAVRQDKKKRKPLEHTLTIRCSQTSSHLYLFFFISAQTLEYGGCVVNNIINIGAYTKAGYFNGLGGFEM